MRSTKHQCPATDCDAMVARSKLMCPTHWRLVSAVLQKRVYAAYKNVHRGGAYEGEHRNACRAAIAEVRAKLEVQRERGAQRGLDL